MDARPDIVNVTLREWQRSRDLIAALTNERKRLTSHLRRLDWHHRRVTEAAQEVLKLIENQIVCMDCCSSHLPDRHYAGCQIGRLKQALRETEQ